MHAKLPPTFSLVSLSCLCNCMVSLHSVAEHHPSHQWMTCSHAHALQPHRSRNNAQYFLIAKLLAHHHSLSTPTFHHANSAHISHYLYQLHRHIILHCLAHQYTARHARYRTRSHLYPTTSTPTHHPKVDAHTTACMRRALPSALSQR